MSEKYAWEGKDIDVEAAKELWFFIDNNGDLYRQQYQPILKNLATKKARGIYNRAKAVTLFGYLTENGAKRYDEELGDAPKGKGRIPSYFPKDVRTAVAEELRDRFEEEWEMGNYDNENFLPKKYLPKLKTTTVKKKKAVTRKSKPASVSGMSSFR